MKCMTRLRRASRGPRADQFGATLPTSRADSQSTPSTSGVIIPAAPPKPNNRARAADPGAMGKDVGRGPDARESVIGDGCLAEANATSAQRWEIMA
jgi:hypothetical protein